jgi:hypothetical protein
MVRFIGMDVHREFAQLAVIEDGVVATRAESECTPEALRDWAAGLNVDDQVALEATGNSDAIANLLTPLVGSGGGLEPVQDQGDRRGEGQDRQGRRADPGPAAGRGLPAAGVAAGRADPQPAPAGDPAGAHRAHRTRLKNQVHAILARNLCPTPPVSDLFGKTGRHWLMRQHAASR